MMYVVYLYNIFLYSSLDVLYIHVKLRWGYL